MRRTKTYLALIRQAMIIHITYDLLITPKTRQRVGSFGPGRTMYPPLWQHKHLRIYVTRDKLVNARTLC